MGESNLDQHEKFILNAIARTGWSVNAVSDHHPPFAYSVGFMHSFDHPEVIIFGMQRELVSKILNGIARMIRGGRRFEEPGLYEDLLANCACKFVSVLRDHHPTYLGYAMWHRRYDGKIGTLRVMQCLWPDKMSGKFPDENGCHIEVIKRQPLLHQIAR
jgi:Domain of unknown function (DUF4262)